MLMILFRLPALAEAGVVVAYWGRWGATTQVVIGAVALGCAPLLIFLMDLRRRWATGVAVQAILSQASVALLIMFVTCLNVALGLASAGGQLIAVGRLELGYVLHVASFVLAAPATGLGAGGCLGLAFGSWCGALQPRWLRWPALLAFVGNLGTLGGLFTLDGIWNSGNGLLGGIAIPLGAVTVYILLASLAWLQPRPRNDHGAGT